MSALASQLNGLPQHALVLTLEYEAEDDGRIIELGQHLAAQQASQTSLPGFAAYTEYPGSSQRIFLLAPLLSTSEAAAGSVLLSDKQEPEAEALETLMDGLKNAESFIATYDPELSNPPAGNQIGSATYVNLISATIKRELAEDHERMAREACKKIVAAHQSSAQGLRFATYHSYSGPDDVFHIVIPFTHRGELDNRIDNRELVAEVYGEDEATSVQEAINRVVVEVKSRVVNRVELYRNQTN